MAASGSTGGIRTVFVSNPVFPLSPLPCHFVAWGWSFLRLDAAPAPDGSSLPLAALSSVPRLNFRNLFILGLKITAEFLRQRRAALRALGLAELVGIKLRRRRFRRALLFMIAVGWAAAKQPFKNPGERFSDGTQHAANAIRKARDGCPATSTRMIAPGRLGAS